MGNLCANRHCRPWCRLALSVTAMYPFQRERPVVGGRITLTWGQGLAGLNLLVMGLKNSS